MRSKDASGYSKVVGGPWRPLLESPCWGWLIAVLTVTVLLPAAADAGCEQVTATLAATVQPQVGPSYVENGYLAIPITPAMAFRGAATISSYPLPANDIHLQFVQNVTAWSGKAKYAEGATLSGRLGAGAAFPLLDRCSLSNPSCDESTFPFFDNTFKGKGQDGRHPCAQGVRPAHSEGAARAVPTTAQAEEDRFHNGVRHVSRLLRSA